MNQARDVIHWRILVSGTVYSPPEIRRFHLQGMLADESEDGGKLLTSSAIVAFEGDCVKTRSGSLYRMVGEPKVDLTPVREEVSVYGDVSEALLQNPAIPLK